MRLNMCHLHLYTTHKVCLGLDNTEVEQQYDILSNNQKPFDVYPAI